MTQQSTPVVIPLLNNLHLSKQCLESVLAQSAPVEAWLLDQGSTDGSVTWAKHKANTVPFVRFISPQCTSLAAAWNHILQFLWSQGHDRALCLNNDTEIRPDTVATLSGYPPFATCVSVRTLVERDQPWTPALTPHPDFSAFMIWESAWKAIGGFDEGFLGAFYEDNAAHVEMHRRGIQAVNVGLPFLHHGSMTIKRADHDSRKRIEARAQCNRKRFHELYGCYPGTRGYDELFRAVEKQPAKWALFS